MSAAKQGRERLMLNLFRCVKCTERHAHVQDCVGVFVHLCAESM